MVETALRSQHACGFGVEERRSIAAAKPPALYGLNGLYEPPRIKLTLSDRSARQAAAGTFTPPMTATGRVEPTEFGN